MANVPNSFGPLLSLLRVSIHNKQFCTFDASPPHVPTNTVWKLWRWRNLHVCGLPWSIHSRRFQIQILSLGKADFIQLYAFWTFESQFPSFHCSMYVYIYILYIFIFTYRSVSASRETRGSGGGFMLSYFSSCVVARGLLPAASYRYPLHGTLPQVQLWPSYDFENKYFKQYFRWRFWRIWWVRRCNRIQWSHWANQRFIIIISSSLNFIIDGSSSSSRVRV